MGAKNPEEALIRAGFEYKMDGWMAAFDGFGAKTRAKNNTKAHEIGTVSLLTVSFCIRLERLSNLQTLFCKPLDSDKK